MAFDLASITCEKRMRAPRIIMLGVEKIGKSTFAAGADSPVFLPIKGEEGIDEIEIPKFPVSNRFGDVMSALCTLYEDAHNHQTVVIDSASAMEPLVWSETCRVNGNAESIEKVGGGYGKGYTEALAWWRQLTEGLDALRSERGMASIIIGHVKIKRYDSPDGDSYDKWIFDLNERAANLLYRWADCILFANTRVLVKSEDIGFNKKHKRGIDAGGGARFLYTGKNPAYPAGGRGVYGRLPNEIQLDWESFISAVNSVQ